MTDSAKRTNMLLNCTHLRTRILSSEIGTPHENLLQVLMATNGISSLMVVATNFIAIFTILRTKSLQKPSNILIIGLAISDLCVGLLSQPSFCAMQFYELKRIFPNYCNATVVYNFFGWTLAAVSLLTLTALTADRFLALHFHLRYQEMVSFQRVGAVLIFIWCYGVMTGVLRLLVPNYVFAINILALILAGLLNVYFICKIFKCVRHHSRQIQAQHQTNLQGINMAGMKKSVNAMYLVLGAFVLCYSPHIGCVLTTAVTQKWNESTRISFRVAESFVLFNSLLNPIIYFWRIKELRKASVRLLRKVFKLNESGEESQSSNSPISGNVQPKQASNKLN